MSTFSSRGLRLVQVARACALLLCIVMPARLSAQVGSPLGETDTTLRRQAQQPRHKPFIEPSESHERAKVKAVVEAAPAQHGRWDTLPYVMPINPVHVALMHDGKVLVIAGSGNDPDNKTLQAAVWEPRKSTIKTFGIAWDMFCDGMVILPDGRPFVLGGTKQYDTPFLGYPFTAAFNVKSETFSAMPSMSGGRWYPTGTVLGNGSVLVSSGLNDTDGATNHTVQIWTGKAWTAAGTVFADVPLYPREHLLPDGKVFESGSNRDSQLYDPAAHTYTTVATTNFALDRDYGSSVLLPLTPAGGFKPKVMILGGASPATDTTELIDLSVPAPKWVDGPRMVKGRIQVNATLLPDGRVLVSGGSEKDEDNATAVKEAQLYDPETNSFSSASTMEFPRLYHSNTLLLPDATVASLGGNPQRKVYQHEIEIYSPPYLFDASGGPAKRPLVTNVAPAPIHYGAPFKVLTPDAKAIKSVVLVRAGAVTHSFDMEQRLVGLSFTAGPGELTARAPANGNLAPPGYYLLFILNAQGVPSVARFVRLAGPLKKGK
jgi:galactose oxidase